MPNTPPTDQPKTKTPSSSSSKVKPVHLLLKLSTDADGPIPGVIEDVEAFTGELKARRALDTRPDWIYLQLTPGQTYTSTRG